MDRETESQKAGVLKCYLGTEFRKTFQKSLESHHLHEAAPVLLFLPD